MPSYCIEFYVRTCVCIFFVSLVEGRNTVGCHSCLQQYMPSPAIKAQQPATAVDPGAARRDSRSYSRCSADKLTHEVVNPDSSRSYGNRFQIPSWYVETARDPGRWCENRVQ